MAVTRNGNVYQLTAATDTIAGTIRINKIHYVQTGGAATAATLKAGGASGITFVSGIPLADDTSQTVFSKPQDVEDLYVSALPSGCNVVVFVD